MRIQLIFFSFLILNGCASFQSSQPLIQNVLAVNEDEIKQIIWLDERANTPEKLSKITFLGDNGQYQSEYRWRQGIMREFEQKGELRIDEETRKHSLLIRYDEEGQAIYQQYRVNGDIFPVKNAELENYYKEAQKAYYQAKLIIKNGKTLFQGHIQNLEITDCKTQKIKKISITDKNHSESIFLDGKKYFMLAMGVESFGRNIAENIIFLTDEKMPCITRPVFQQDK